MTIRTLLVANRGEIAVRIIRAAKALGIRTVQAYSDADADSLAVRLADARVNIGPPHATKSYLNIARIVEAALDSSADAIHPGYGFLAENAAFAEAVAAAGLTFVGPSAEAIRLMGDKVSARAMAARAGVPTVPGSAGRVEGVEAARAVVAETGFPVMIKAAAGGGGRGIRIARSMEEFERLWPQASAEAKAAFGDGGLYLERVVENARHVEVQVLGDGRRAVHCFERECSLQRRRQKVWEEAPFAGLAEDVRARLCGSAVALAEAVGYSGAGTVEYLYDDASGAFYFLEMNTRIQVEHPVTEMITGIDLVGEMLRIAGGEPLRFAQADIGRRGHAIEVRLNAEDPDNGFLPGPGVVSDFRAPGGPGVRFDTMLFDGYAIPPFYDSLLGKLIVWGEDRPTALARLGVALGELNIGGLKTTRSLFERLGQDADVRAGQFHTRWLEGWLEGQAGGRQ
jgi:acetyl-CoA carboxylase biotin carboxylase subunit